MANVNKHTRLNPSTLQCLFLPGSNIIRIAATPMNALSPHQPFPPRPESSPAAWISRCSGTTDAVNVPDVARTLTVNWPVALVLPFGTMIVNGELLHATPGGIAAGQFTVTGPENPPLAVTDTVELWLAPVDESSVTALSATAMLGTIGAVTVKFTEFE
jgi:hypothetical protein